MTEEIRFVRLRYVHGKGGPQFINTKTGDLVSPRAVVEMYNLLCDACERVYRMAMAMEKE